MSLYGTIAQAPTWQRIVTALRTAILTGKLAAGSRIVEANLAQELGVSRAPVREALRHLELEGLLVSSPYRETRVATLTEAEVSEVLVPIRIMAESLAVRRAVTRLTERDFARLESLVEEMRAAAARGDSVGLSERDVEFHRILVAAADAESLMQIWSGLMGRIQLGIVRRSAQDRQLDLQAPDQHHELLRVLRQRDPDLAAACMPDHIGQMSPVHPVLPADGTASTQR